VVRCRLELRSELVNTDIATAAWESELLETRAVKPYDIPRKRCDEGEARVLMPVPRYPVPSQCCDALI
jgi:hypothetical protein